MGLIQSCCGRCCSQRYQVWYDAPFTCISARHFLCKWFFVWICNRSLVYFLFLFLFLFQLKQKATPKKNPLRYYIITWNCICICVLLDFSCFVTSFLNIKQSFFYCNDLEEVEITIWWEFDDYFFRLLFSFLPQNNRYVLFSRSQVSQMAFFKQFTKFWIFLQNNDVQKCYSLSVRSLGSILVRHLIFQKKCWTVKQLLIFKMQLVLLLMLNDFRFFVKFCVQINILKCETKLLNQTVLNSI